MTHICARCGYAVWELTPGTRSCGLCVRIASMPTHLIETEREALAWYAGRDPDCSGLWQEVTAMDAELRRRRELKAA